jgi:transposase-like protein
MTRARRDILRKKRVLEHAQRIGNVRKACRHYGVSRAAFYLWKKAYETYGDEGLVKKKPCPVFVTAERQPLYRRQRQLRSPCLSIGCQTGSGPRRLGPAQALNHPNLGFGWRPGEESNPRPAA